MLTTPEIFYLSSLFVSQGVTKIRLTGGEPTVRRDIVPLMQQIGTLRPRGLRELALTTNGISLHRKLDAMVEAGLTGVNLSLDTLDPFQFQIMTRRKGFDAVMKSIDRILEMNKLGANVKLKVNCVVMRGLNEREILPFVEMGREKDIEVRFIEYMPFGGNKWSENKMISFQEMLDIIRAKYPGLRPVAGHKNDTSKTYEVPGFVGKVGFITSMTNDFCGSCNRLRITSDGNLKVCLHGNAEVSLRDVLRQGNNGEPIDQEAFERIKQIEMDRHQGRLSDETILGWGQRERELLDVVGAAVKRKAEKHADLDDLANMENRPMILIDQNMPSPSLHSRWPSVQTRSRSPANHLSSLSTWTGMHAPSTYHLHPTFSPVGTSVRAFSSVTRLSVPSRMAGRHEHGYFDTPRADIVRDTGMLKGVIKHGIVKMPLPPSLEEVRQKYGLDGPEFNGYWLRAADTQLRRRMGNKTAMATARAESKLQSLLKDTGKDLTLTHEGLMKEATRIANEAFREKQAVPFKRHQMITTTIKKFIEEATIPQDRERTLKHIHSKIEELEHLMERIASKASTSNRAETDSQIASGTSELDSQSQKKAKTPTGQRKSGFHSHKELQKEMRLENTGTKAPQSAGEAESISTKIQQMQILLDSYKQQAAEVQAETQKLEDIRSRREELLAKKRALLDKMREQEVKVRETDRLVRIQPQPLSNVDVDDILQDALNNLEEGTQGTGARVRVSEHRDVETATQTEDKTSFTLRKTGSDRISVLRSRDSGTAAAEGQHGGDMIADSTMDKADTISAPRQSTGSGLSAIESSTVLKGLPTPRSPDMLASTTFPPPRPRVPSLFSQGNKPLRKPSDELHFDVTPAGFIPIDENLVVSFEASVPLLQSQVFEMRERLKRAYPRIDTLPYEIWKSENLRTLQTWLKILVRRWQTRFDEVETSGKLKKGMRDARIEDVLDMMVRDHDLSNEAAERMAVRWYEVFDDRGAMDGDAEGKIDWDELHAGGWDFLLDEGDSTTSQPQVSSENKTFPVVPENAKSTVMTVSSEQPLPGWTTRRMYSTSSRPPRNPESAQDPKQTSDEKTTSSSTTPGVPKTTLPHLTSSGSAHMVSVSAKQDTVRTAIAVGTVYFTNPTPLSLIQSNSAKKGDVLGVSRIAGIMAAKKCPDLIPLCHPIALTHVGVELKPFGPEDANEEGDYGGVHVEAKVQCVGPTGVEMEALTAVMGAALSVVDMCKAVDKFQRVSDVRVVLKEGGKSGTWREEGWASWQE